MKFFILLLATTSVRALQTIQSSNKFQKSFHSTEQVQNYEFKIDSTVKNTNENFLTFSKLNFDSLLYCLGSTTLTVSFHNPKTILILSNNLLDLRDKLQKGTPSKFTSFYNFFKPNSSKDKFKFEQLPKIQNFTRSFSPYNEKYLGIQTNSSFTIKIVRKKLEIFKILILILAILTFSKAQELAHQAAVWYFGGVSISVSIGTILLIYFILNKFLPKRVLWIFAGIGGCSAWVEYAFSGFIRNAVLNLIRQNLFYFTTYLVIFSIIGFVYCYIKGPPNKSSRIPQVLQFFLQILASVAIYWCFNIPEIGLFVVGIVAFTNLFYGSFGTIKIKRIDGKVNKDFNKILRKKLGKSSILSKKSTFNNNKKLKNTTISNLFKNSPKIDIRDQIFPENLVSVSSRKRKSKTPATLSRQLQTEDEYLSEGHKLTQIELAKLKKFCTSPESNPWKQVSKIKNPKRFSSFIAGSPHISEIELSNFESDMTSNDISMDPEYNDTSVSMNFKSRLTKDNLKSTPKRDKNDKNTDEMLNYYNDDEDEFSDSDLDVLSDQELEKISKEGNSMLSSAKENRSNGYKIKKPTFHTTPVQLLVKKYSNFSRPMTSSKSSGKSTSKKSEMISKNSKLPIIKNNKRPIISKINKIPHSPLATKVSKQPIKIGSRQVYNPSRIKKPVAYTIPVNDIKSK